jgi:hypothetical protein
MLSRVEEIVDGDLFVIQSGNYTKAIDFTNINLLKTDVNKNATAVGSLSGHNGYIQSLSALSAIAGNTFFANGLSGVFLSANLNNTFTINGGLITRSTSVTGSPEYMLLTTTTLSALTTYQNSLYRYIVDESSTSDWINPSLKYMTVSQSTTTAAYILSGFFTRNPRLTLSELKPFHFFFTPVVTLSSQPFVTEISADYHNNLVFKISTGYRVKYETPLLWRVLYSELI